MTNPQAPPSLAGYGPPRTGFAGFGDMAQGSLAIVSQLTFGAPGSAWLRDGDWREIPALVDEDWTPRKNVPYQTLVYTGSQYQFRVTSGGGPGAWRLVEPTSFPEQPGPTVRAEDEKPGTFYTDLRDDSSWWRYDDGEWVDASLGGASVPGTFLTSSVVNGTVTQSGATISCSGYVRAIVTDTDVSYEKAAVLSAEIYINASDEGGDGSNIVVDMGMLLDAIGFTSWYIESVSGPAAMVLGSIGGTDFAGYLTDWSNLFGFDGNPVTAALTDGDAIRFHASWIISND